MDQVAARLTTSLLVPENFEVSVPQRKKLTHTLCFSEPRGVAEHCCRVIFTCSLWWKLFLVALLHTNQRLEHCANTSGMGAIRNSQAVFDFLFFSLWYILNHELDKFCYTVSNIYELSSSWILFLLNRVFYISMLKW